MKGLYMGTTKIALEKTAVEIQTVLARYGVSKVQSRYENLEVVGLDFSVKVKDTELYFSLPVRWEPVLVVLRNTRNGKYKRTEDQAKRIAWRQALRWIEAQLAMVEVGMVEMEEVFLPYLITSKGTLYEQLSEKGFKQIGYDK